MVQSQEEKTAVINRQYILHDFNRGRIKYIKNLHPFKKKPLKWSKYRKCRKNFQNISKILEIQEIIGL